MANAERAVQARRHVSPAARTTRRSRPLRGLPEVPSSKSDCPGAPPLKRHPCGREGHCATLWRARRPRSENCPLSPEQRSFSPMSSRELPACRIRKFSKGRASYRDEQEVRDLLREAGRRRAGLGHPATGCGRLRSLVGHRLTPRSQGSALTQCRGGALDSPRPSLLLLSKTSLPRDSARATRLAQPSLTSAQRSFNEVHGMPGAQTMPRMKMILSDQRPLIPGASSRPRDVICRPRYCGEKGCDSCF